MAVSHITQISVGTGADREIFARIPVRRIMYALKSGQCTVRDLISLITHTLKEFAGAVIHLPLVIR